MKRRDLLKLTALTAGAATLRATPSRALLAHDLATPDPAQVKRVLVVTLCHLDIGFTATQSAVLQKYFNVYYPQAMQTAATLRAGGHERYTWTTAAWLLYEYLEQATPQQRRQIEQAIAAGDIDWHALPFNWQTEMLDPTLIQGALGFSATLDSRFGHKTTGAKMSDVPGHTRGIIRPLADAGVKLLDIGVNAASTPPEVPPVFLWKDPSGASLVMMYHHHDYGGTLQIPGTGTAVAMEVRNDNSGPHSLTEIAAIYSRLGAQFPNATLHASNLTEVAQATDHVRDRLPIVTAEIGDTWIYGVPSDPVKVSRYCQTARLRRQWIADKKLTPGDATDLQLQRRFALAVEHTWGTDTKTYLDNDHYKPADLKQVLDQPGYRTMTTSWQEKRDDIDAGIATLPPAFLAEVQHTLQQLTPKIPSQAGLQPANLQSQIATSHFLLSIDPANGSIVGLKNRKTGREWASPNHPLALFTYQTLSAPDFSRFLDTYVKSKADWAPRDFGKPNIEHFGALSREWHPTVTDAWSGDVGSSHRILVKMKIDDSETAVTGLVAWPADLYLELILPEAEPVVQMQFLSFGKVENRLPEAMWLTFNPEASSPRLDSEAWLLEKSGQPLRPSDVIRGGGRNMHAVSGPIRYTAGSNNLELTTQDAPVVALGQRSPLNFSLHPPDLSTGIHVCLFNNAWGTNYIQWCGGDWAYRFTLRP